MVKLLKQIKLVNILKRVNLVNIVTLAERLDQFHMWTKMKTSSVEISLIENQNQ